jgi:hypothetical protein
MEEKAAAVITEEEEGEWLSIRQREELALQVSPTRDNLTRTVGYFLILNFFSNLRINVFAVFPFYFSPSDFFMY